MATFREFARENSDGWSLIAVRSTIDSVAAALSDPGMSSDYTTDVELRIMENSRDEQGNVISFTPAPTERSCFVVALHKSKWCVIFRTLYWCEEIDFQWVDEMAKALSTSLGCEAIASCGGGHGFSTRIFEASELQAELPAYETPAVAKEFTKRKIRLPMCFIGGKPDSLYVQRDAATEIERVDRFVWRSSAKNG